MATSRGDRAEHIVPVNLREPHAADDSVHTIGISIGIPEPQASELRAVRASLGDPLAETVAPHVTLVGPLEAPESAFVEIVDHVVAVAGEVAPFSLVIAGTDSFRPVSDVVFLKILRGESELHDLAGRLRTGILAEDLRFPFHPHVTLGHDVPHEQLDRAEREMNEFAMTMIVRNFAIFLRGPFGKWRKISKVLLEG